MNDFLVNPTVGWVAAALFAALVLATLLRLAASRRSASDAAERRFDSIKTWWALAVLLVAAALLGRVGLVALFTVISWIALGEFVRLSPEMQRNRQLVWAAHLLIPLNYLCLAMGWRHAFAVLLPLAAVGVLGTLLVLQSQTAGFVNAVTRSVWGLLVAAYFPAHAVLLLALPPESNPVAGVEGWFFTLVILTVANDIAQALIGRRIGRRKLRPLVSPRKTWEGFCGGVVATSLLAVAVARWLTPLGAVEAGAVGLAIAIAGTLGDLNMSAVKRDAGVKDSGNLLPGQGGMLDRIDSLTFSAPVFYYLILLMVETAR